MYSGDSPTDAYPTDHTEAFGSLPPMSPDDLSLPAIGPLPAPEPRVSSEPEVPEIVPLASFAGGWSQPEPREYHEEIVPGNEPWTLEAPPAPLAPPMTPEPLSRLEHSAPAPFPPSRPPGAHPSSFAPPVVRAPEPRRKLSPVFWIGVVASAIAAIGLGVLFAAVWSAKGGPDIEGTRKKYATILEGQPDFIGTLEGYENGAPVKLKYATLKGERMVEVALPRSMFLGTSASGSTQVSVIFGKDGNVTAVAHEFWTYRTMPVSSLGVLAGAADPFGELSRIAKEKNTTITEAGTEKVGNYDSTVLYISEPGSPLIQANVAPELNNLVVRLDVPAGAMKSPTSFRYSLSNVSMTVDPELFRVPTSYNELKAP
jgi:hypothetical protein